MYKSYIATPVIKRLPRYYRFLSELCAGGMTRISSKELAKRMGLTASQVRQDFNCFGGFGQQGYGYNIQQLKDTIGGILGLDQLQKMILIGAGNMGRAIGNEAFFNTCGFQLIGVFDKKPSLTGQIVNSIPVRHTDGLDEFCKENLPVAAALCIPNQEAKEVVRQLVGLGIKAIWNFTHYDPTADFPELIVENVHLRDSLMTFGYGIKNQ